ncbi:MAG: hypothetical protein V3W04_10080 [Gammaproteobacteria bacterium]
MSQTTMKIDRDVLADLRELASLAHRSPQKHLRHWLKKKKQNCSGKIRRYGIYTRTAGSA